MPLLPPTSGSLAPMVLLALALLLGGYLVAIGPLRRARGEEPVARRRIACFVAGWLMLALALVSPLDTLGRYYLLVAHTLQLLVLTTLSAPLLLLGLPEWLVAMLLPLRALRNATRGLLFTVICVLAFNGIILIWHIGPLYEAALRESGAPNLQSLSFLFAGIVTWWPLLTPLDRQTRMASPVQILYLTLESLPLDIFGAIAIFAGKVFYPAYAATPRIWGLAALTDQQIAGALLAVPGNLLDIVLMSVVFFSWIAKMEAAQRERERLAFASEAAEEKASVPTPDVPV